MGSDKKAPEEEVVEQGKKAEDVQATEDQAEETQEATDLQSEETAGSDKKAAEEEVVEQGKKAEDVQATVNQAEETQEATAPQSESDTSNIQRILDIELPLKVTFGATRRPLREVLQLAPGSRLELNNRAYEPVIVSVNNKVFGRGEVVVVDGHYGVRIQEIATAADRIASLGE